MKYRFGLVSNSSSSTFIVQISPTEWDKHFNTLINVISDKQMDVLNQIGFVKVYEENPFYYQVGGRGLSDSHNSSDEDPCFMGFNVVCNQDDIMKNLIAHNIPFKGAIHYGHEFYYYNKNSKFLMMVPNQGLSIEMYFKNENALMIQELKQSKPRKIPIKKYMKEYAGEITNPVLRNLKNG